MNPKPPRHRAAVRPAPILPGPATWALVTLPTGAKVYALVVREDFTAATDQAEPSPGAASTRAFKRAVAEAYRRAYLRWPCFSPDGRLHDLLLDYVSRTAIHDHLQLHVANYLEVFCEVLWRRIETRRKRAAFVGKTRGYAAAYERSEARATARWPFLERADVREDFARFIEKWLSDNPGAKDSPRWPERVSAIYIAARGL